MTEPRLRELFVACEGARDGMVARASALSERAFKVSTVRDEMAEAMIAAGKGIPIPPEAFAEWRMRLFEVEDALATDALAEAAAAESLTNRVALARKAFTDPARERITRVEPEPGPGAPAMVDPNADTLDMDLEEIASANAEDEKP